MRKLKLITLNLLFVLVFTFSAWATEFDKTVSITGASAQRLSTVLVANGWTGAYTLKELTITNYDDGALTIYVGQSTVATDGYSLPPGHSFTWRSSGSGEGIDTTQKYIYVASTQNIGISCRSY
jgi:hypothetical protein